MSIQTQQDSIIATLNSSGIAVSGSTTSERRKWTYAHAVQADLLEKQQDQFKADVVDYVQAMYPHRKGWFESKTLDYQHGFNLLPDGSDNFDNTGYTDAQILASKVVAFAAVEKLVNVYGRVRVRIKAARLVGTDLAPLTTAQLNGLKAYWERIEPAGVVVDVVSLPADDLKQEWEIFYDPLLVDASGNRLDGSASDIARAAIKAYLLQLPYNGLFVNAYHIDFVQKVEGIVIPELKVSQARYGALAFADVVTEYPTDAGYLRFIDDTYLTIIYKPHIAI